MPLSARDPRDPESVATGQAQLSVRIVSGRGGSSQATPSLRIVRLRCRLLPLIALSHPGVISGRPRLSVPKTPLVVGVPPVLQVAAGAAGEHVQAAQVP
jgi:hypothetical protein